MQIFIQSKNYNEYILGQHTLPAVPKCQAYLRFIKKIGLSALPQMSIAINFQNRLWRLSIKLLKTQNITLKCKKKKHFIETVHK